MEVHAKGQELFDELKEFGLTEKDLVNLADQAARYKAKIDAPHGAIVDRSVATDDIAAIIRAGNKALHVIDKLINTFADDYPEFVAAYKKARIVVDNRGGGTETPSSPGDAQ